ncbi:MAG: hypothetical protein QOG04_1194 [Actinomycetota bacterium]|nr:hypothetical protein [Actinomycetota bacterium]
MRVTPSATPSATPTPVPAFRFAVIGDYGSGWPSQHDVAQRMCDWREDHPFDDVITTGDNIYPDGSKQYFQRGFFSPYDCLLSNDVEFHASLGNHDYVTRRGGDVLDEPAFGIPKRNYVYREGGVRFVIADSNVLNREWLSDALKPLAEDRWTVVVFHHPVYSPSPERPTEPGFRPSLPRLFRKRGVDLVLNGHAHIYFASKPLRRIRYVITGGGGASLYSCSTKWYVHECQARNHFVYVAATADRLTVRAIAPNGPPFDKFTTTGR